MIGNAGGDEKERQKEWELVSVYLPEQGKHSLDGHCLFPTNLISGWCTRAIPRADVANIERLVATNIARDFEPSSENRKKGFE